MARLAVLLLVVVLASAVHAGPQPIINFQIKHYAVSGRTTAEINQSVYQNTPVVMRGGRYGAVTHNQFSTSYASVATSQGCAVKNLTSSPP